MTVPRDWMTLTIGAPTGGAAPSSVAAADSRFRLVTPADAESLAVLMLESYRGTVDDGGKPTVFDVAASRFTRVSKEGVIARFEILHDSGKSFPSS